MAYIGTFQLMDGAFINHLFEVTDARKPVKKGA
jgi:hypothetical protein